MTHSEHPRAGVNPSDDWAAWFRAASQPPIAQRLQELCCVIEQRIVECGPVCWASGRCCRFDTYGHRLYVTALEIAWVLRNLPKDDATSDRDTRLELLQPSDSCTFQRDRQCTIHTIRPPACRLFFCQRDVQHWQQALHERILAQVKALHREYGLAYRYMEWRAGLAEAQAYVDVAG